MKYMQQLKPDSQIQPEHFIFYIGNNYNSKNSANKAMSEILD